MKLEDKPITCEVSESIKDYCILFKTYIHTLENFFQLWPGWLQFLSLFAGVAAIVIAIFTLLGTFRPLITLSYTPSEDKMVPQGFENFTFSSDTRITVNNIGNRPARRVYLKSGRIRHGDQFILEANEKTVCFIPAKFDKNLRVYYKRSKYTPFFFRGQLKESQSLIYQLKKLKPSSDIRTIAGRKKLRKFFQNISRKNLPADEIIVSLFSRDTRSDTSSKLSVGYINKYVDSEYMNCWIDSPDIDVAFELSQILGKSGPTNAVQTSCWVLSKKDFESRVHDFYSKSLFSDFIDVSKKIQISTESLYASLNTDNSLVRKRKINPNDIAIQKYSSSNHGKSRSIVLDSSMNLAIRTTDRFFHFDDDGFISADTRRDLVQSQELGKLYKDELVFLISNESVFISGPERYNELNGATANLEVSKIILKFVKSSIKLGNLNSKSYKEGLVKNFSRAISYIIWSFKSPISKDWY